MSEFKKAVTDALKTVAHNTEREEDEAPVAPPEAEETKVTQAPSPEREIVMRPTPGNAPDAKWRQLMAKTADRPDVEVQRDRLKKGCCPVCDTRGPRQGKVSAPQLVYCEECAYPYHMYAH